MAGWRRSGSSCGLRRSSVTNGFTFSVFPWKSADSSSTRRDCGEGKSLSSRSCHGGAGSPIVAISAHAVCRFIPTNEQRHRAARKNHGRKALEGGKFVQRIERQLTNRILTPVESDCTWECFRWYSGQLARGESSGFADTGGRLADFIRQNNFPQALRRARKERQP